MARIETAVGSNALSASLAAGSGTLLIQMNQLGGFQTFASSSYNTGRAAAKPIVRPDSDVTTDQWTPLTLFSQLSESVADGAVSEIVSEPLNSEAPSSSTRFFEVGMSDPGPTKITNADVSFTAATSASNEGSASSGEPTASVTVEVREGAAVRATRTFTDIGLAFAPVEFSLTAAEVATVGDWRDVRLHAEFELSVTTASQEVGARVTQAQIQLRQSSIIEAPPVDNIVYQLVWED